MKASSTMRTLKDALNLNRKGMFLLRGYTYIINHMRIRFEKCLVQWLAWSQVTALIWITQTIEVDCVGTVVCTCKRQWTQVDNFEWIQMVPGSAHLKVAIKEYFDIATVSIVWWIQI